MKGLDTYTYSCGIDLSLNHFGIVLMDIKSSKVIQWVYGTNVKKRCKREKSFYSVFINKAPKEKEQRETYKTKRMCQVLDGVCGFLADQYDIVTSLEDYAYSGVSQSMTGLAEISGCLKEWLWKEEVPFRLTDPQTLKMWVSKGGLSKREMRKAAPDFVPDDLFYEKKTKKGTDLDGPGTDVVDAYWLADILRVEILVRMGKVALADLPQKKRDVFNRVTKQNPTNLLAHPFVWNQ